MATLTRVQAKITGTVLTATAATAGPDKVLPDAGGPVYVIVENASGSTVTVSVADPGIPKYGQTLPAIVSVAVPATTGRVVIGPIGMDLKQPSDALAWLTASAATSVTFYAFRG